MTSCFAISTRRSSVFSPISSGASSPVANGFARGLDLAALSGTVLMVPAQNPLALQAQHRVFVGHYLKSPLDQSPNDPWISFPGDADGNMAAQLAHALFDRLMRHADYL